MMVLVNVTREEFEAAVADALDLIPPELTGLMDNVVILVVDDVPPEHGDPDMLGLYEGVPLTERDLHWAAGALPDRISIFMNPLIRFVADNVDVFDYDESDELREPCEDPDCGCGDDPEVGPLTEQEAREAFYEYLREEIALTVRHEVAHHFGIDDERLDELVWS
jgi:predicted Zn-dependent protease with MMP-like domain